MASPPQNPVPELVLDESRDLSEIFKSWESQHSTAGYDPEPIVARLAQILEEETVNYYRKDPDPFDERHPSRTDPECELGRMLKILFRKDHFMTRLVNDYLRDNFFTRQSVQKSSKDLNIAACRLILIIMPGLETSAVFQLEFDNLITRLYTWAEKEDEPLRSYATGLLGAAMEVNEIASSFRDSNIRLLPIMLKRLHELQHAYKNRSLYFEALKVSESEANSKVSSPVHVPTIENAVDEEMNEDEESSTVRPFAHLGGGSVPNSPDAKRSKAVLSPAMNGVFKDTTDLSALFANESNASTQDRSFIRNIIPIYPPTMATSQMLILRYLTPMGEYQEFLPHVFEHKAMNLILQYIENLDPKETGLAFEALKYLASLLCHKKFSLEFIAHGGLDYLLKVPRPSIAATGVSIALYYLAYCEDAMERICSMQQKTITELVKYALWLLGCSHDSGRCHATMFFGLSFQFKQMLNEFDAQDGLRKMYNVIAVLPILAAVDDYNLSDDEEIAARQVVRHVSVALKKYFESHLYYKYTQATRQQSPANTLLQPASAQAVLKAAKSTPEVISEQIRALQEILPMRAHWAPVDELLNLGGVTLLLRTIAFAYEWNYNFSRSYSAETVRSALDVLNICCVVPKVHNVFCERIDFPDEASSAGINIVLGAAEGEIVADAEVQKSALAVLVHSVCAPVHRPIGSVASYGSTRKKTANKCSEELIQKVWENVRSNNGIIVLLKLMMVKSPITDADFIRAMACQALAGLARSETVRQIISKLPLFTTGQLQTLVRDPILQEKRTEHVQFQKYALELMERVSGKTKTLNNEFDTSLVNIHKANVVAQTKIQFNEQQLYQLIHQHLVERGLSDTAAVLQKEANMTALLPPRNGPSTSQAFLSPFQFRTPTTPNISRSRLRSKTAELNFASMDLGAIEPVPNGGVNQIVPNFKPDATEEDNTFSTTPIKLIKKANNSLNSAGETVAVPKSLEKQLSHASFIGPTPAQRSTQPLDSQPNVTLDTIITEYLTNQHALCKNPMSTCPQFDLFVPHKCPDLRPNKASGLSLNFAGRFFARSAGFNTTRLDRKYVHTNFATAKTIRCQDSDFFFTCSDFMPCTTKILVGSHNGEVKVFNLNDGTEEFSYQCHESYVNHIQCNRLGNMVLTASTWRSPLTALWFLDNKQFIQKATWETEEYVEFSNLTQDKVIGTKNENATIYDVSTGQKIKSLVPTIYNQYTKNRATFCPTDELILSDGVLWDFRSGREIHKFDKLNQTLSGVFHPNGLEVISNTEVWDLRTFHLLRTVSTLDQCQVIFSPQNVIYAISSELEPNMDSDTSTYESSYKTLDMFDYSSISTIDVKKNVYDLCVNKYGSQIAVVENHGEYDSVQESVIRVYSVGRQKNTEDDADDDEEEVENSDDNSMSDGESTAAFENDNGLPAGNNRRNRRNRRLGPRPNAPNDSSSSDSDLDSNNDTEDDDNNDDDADGDNNDLDDDDDSDGSDVNDIADAASNNSWTTTSDAEFADFLDDIL